MPIYTYIIETSQVTHKYKMVQVLEDMYGRDRFGVQEIGPNGFRIKVTTFDPKAPWERLRALGVIVWSELERSFIHLQNSLK
ncbi:unnamed protein product [Fusarium graminearum]|uniref:Chromosome 2, complete genome n=1 Tax=Gibberella zeae (strain ATCC MYA-4620 / CBS 123657 / FGSC 9075 / NRRL 31084 / PH-1) TaxID=229533 RepID=A0A098DKJ0_GIBZE|nr:unnamed protein product [Fusarium graminearum]